MVELFTNSEDPDQTPQYHLNQTPDSAESDLGQHCLPVILFGVSRLQ